MLGWFKKKFSKKEDAPSAPPDTQAPVAATAETSPDHPPAPAEPEPAVEAAPAATDAVAELPVGAEPAAEPVTEAATAMEPVPATDEKDEQEGEEEPAAEEAGAATTRPSFLQRLAERLSKTREAFTYQLDRLFLGKKEIDAELFDDLEELLITADLGVATTRELLDHARRKVHRKELSDPESLKIALKDKIKSFITDYQRDAELVMPQSGPFVIMVVGVNGVGKTTTIGKIAHKFVKAGRSVMLVAGDTFRAAAVSQLQIWGERNGVYVVARADGADPSSVAYDAMDIAKAKNYDVVLVDTAGRLHTQTNLMEELKKIKRVMGKRLEGAPHEVMLVIDATTGQNGISQAKLFNEAVGITGITLTKLDGTAKGGIVANICREMQTPIRFIGVGEKMEDLRDFDPDEFIEALFESRLPER
ncbi:MAG: signal recognition particle-docking protein FtsY [Desulfoprunum sp.]|nr:cell division protein FtsY [Desulfobulbus sp. Tol-SR]